MQFMDCWMVDILSFCSPTALVTQTQGQSGYRSKTVNPLDSRRGHVDSKRGWLCRDPADPQSVWLIVVPAPKLADLKVPRKEEPKIGCQIAFSPPILAKLLPLV